MPERRGGSPLDGAGAISPLSREPGVPAWEWWRHASVAILEKYIEVYLSLKKSLRSDGQGWLARARGFESRRTGAVERACTRRSLQVSPSRTRAGRPSATAVAISTACRMTP